MGLLDQVLGQVMGQLGGGGLGGPGRAAGRPSGLPPAGSRSAPSSGGANVNPLVMALLALVASRVMHQGAGGLGSKLRDLITGGGPPDPGTGSGLPSPDYQGGGGIATGTPSPRSGGGFLDQIGGMLDNPAAGRAGGGMPGGLGGGLVAGGLGGLVGSGLGGLLERFQQNGHGDAFNSWVGPGQNQAIAPDELDGALGQDTVDELARETGMERGDLLSQLSHALPQVVDGLTPDGRLPDDDEQSRWV